MNKICLILAFLTFLNPACAKVIEDNLADAIPDNIGKPYVHKDYNYESTKKIPLRISIKEKVKSEKDLYEGQIVEFIVQKSIYENGIIKIRRGDIIKAKVSTIITSGMNGIPASVIFNSFEMEDAPKRLKPGQVTGSLEVFGADRTYFVFPLKWALTILPPTGSLTNFIKGGHVKIKTNKIYTLYYYPKWL